MKTLTKIFAGLCFLPLLGVAGCAAETGPSSVGTQKQAMEDDMPSITELVKAQAWGNFVAQQPAVASLDAATPFAIDDKVQGYDDSKAAWASFAALLQSAESAHGITQLSWSLLSATEQRYKTDFRLENGSVAHVNSTDYRTQLRGFVSNEAILEASGPEGLDYVQATGCANELHGPTGEVNACTRILGLGNDLVALMNQEAPHIARARIASARIARVPGGFSLDEVCEFDPLQADSYLSTTITEASDECAISNRSGLYYVNSAQAVNTMCMRAVAGVPLTGQSCAPSGKVLDANKRCN